jgi:PAS domain S-box-containing protein
MNDLNKTKQELVAEIQALRVERDVLKTSREKEIAEHNREAEKLKEAEFNIKERVKELQGIYSLGLAIEKKTSEDVYNELVKVIVPESMQFPEKVYASLQIDDRKFCNIENFDHSKNGKYLSAPVNLFGKQSGELIVGYTEELQFIDIFEQKLIDAFAQRISGYTERILTERALQENEGRYQNLIRNVRDMIVWFTPQGVFQGLNEAFVPVTGWQKHELVGKPFIDLVHPEDIRKAANYMSDVLKGLTPGAIDIRLKKKSGRYLSVEVLGSPIIEDGKITGILGIARDISDRKEAEEKIINANRVYAVISQINQTIVHSTKKDELFKDVCRIAVEFGEFQMAWVGLLSEHSKFIHPVAFAGFENGYLTDMKAITLEDVPEGRGPTGTSIREKKLILCNDIENDPRMVLWKEEALKRGYRSSIALPIKFFGDVIGALTLYSDKPFFFDEKEIRLLDEVVSDIGFALELFEKEEKRKTAESALIESEEKYRNIFETTIEGFYQTTPEGKYINVNPAFAGMLGYSSPREIIESISDIGKQLYVDPARRLKFKQLLSENNVVKGFEALLKKKDGSIMWGQINAKIIRNDKGETLYYQGGMLDITESKQAKEKLLESEKRYRTFLNSTTDFVFLKDERFKHIFANKSYCDSYNMTEEEILGKTDFDLMPDAYALNCLSSDNNALKINDVVVTEELWGEKTYETVKFPVEYQTGKTGIGGFVRDISERKLKQKEINELNAELEYRVIERTAQLQTTIKELETFSYSVSHDLRAPLRAIDGFTRILFEEYQPKFDEEGKRLCDLISTNTRQMGQLIDNLLAFSRLNRVSTIICGIDMKEIAGSVYSELTSPEMRENIDFTLGDISPVYGDQSLIRQVWTNLISNAIKFSSHRDQPVIKIQSKQEINKVVYSIIDNGAGFDMKYSDKLFGVFQRLHSVKDFEGTGIGLAIVKNIIDRHDGQVWAESEIDKGATFYFSLPLMVEK